MTPSQVDALLTMLCGVRVGLLALVDAIEVYLIANGQLERRTSELRRRIKADEKFDRELDSVLFNPPPIKLDGG